METIRNILNFSVGTVTVSKIFTAVLLLLICLTVIKIVSRATDHVLQRRSVDPAIGSFVRPLVRIVLYFIAVLMVADHVGIPVSSLLAVFSVAGLAASLAMQDTLSNFASGILLLVTKPFRTGDYIECGTETGTVTSISLVYTKMNTIDNRAVCIPNKDVAAAKLVNYSANDTRRIDLTFSAAYGCPVEEVKAALLEAVSGVNGALREPEPFAGVNDYKASSIEYITRTWCATGDYLAVRGGIIESVKRVFDARGIEMTYDHLNVHILNS